VQNENTAAAGEFKNGFTVVMSRFGTSGYKYEFPF